MCEAYSGNLSRADTGPELCGFFDSIPLLYRNDESKWALKLVKSNERKTNNDEAKSEEKVRKRSRNIIRKIINQIMSSSI